MARVSVDHDLTPFLKWWDTLSKDEKRRILSEIDAVVAPK
jgi:hypothetical protein